MSANDVQVGGTHYQGAEYQLWDLLADLGLSYLAGNIAKYVARYKLKDGVKDLRKAVHYATKYAETLPIGIVGGYQKDHEIAKLLRRYYGGHPQLDPHQVAVITLLAYGHSRMTVLEHVVPTLLKMIGEATETAESRPASLPASVPAGGAAPAPTGLHAELTTDSSSGEGSDPD